MLSNMPTCRLGSIDYSQAYEYFLSIFLGYYYKALYIRDMQEKKCVIFLFLGTKKPHKCEAL